MLHQNNLMTSIYNKCRIAGAAVSNGVIHSKKKDVFIHNNDGIYNVSIIENMKLNVVKDVYATELESVVLKSII